MTASLPENAFETRDQQVNNYRKHALIAALVFFFLLLACFYETSWSVVSIWMRSDTYTHGFLILPIVAWMVWGKRQRVYRHIVMPEPYALAPLLACGFAWLLGDLVDVLVVQQFALVGMLISGVWLILGSSAARQIAFPLAYLLFLIPVGQGLVPPMMEYTATFTVAMVELTGVPVYREGMFFVLPSGSWSVVEACSGVRYLIASTALGALYAYMNYMSLWRRGAFIAASIVVPIIANGLRAYFIVMLGHVSDMTIATGVDHLIYGWVFFGLVMFLLFYLGSFWHEEASDFESESGLGESIAVAVPKESVRYIYATFSAALVAAALWPMLSWSIEQRHVGMMRPLSLPYFTGNWQKTDTASDWKPLRGGAEQVAHAAYLNGESTMPVQVTIHTFANQTQGAELVAGKDLANPDRKLWRTISRTSHNELDSQIVGDVREIHLRGPSGGQYLVWQFYRVGNRYTASDYGAKILEAVSKLSFARTDTARLFFATRISEGKTLGQSRKELRRFLDDGFSALEITMDEAVGQR